MHCIALHCTAIDFTALNHIALKFTIVHTALNQPVNPLKTHDNIKLYYTIIYYTLLKSI